MTTLTQQMHGTRVRLISTSDQYTDLKPGDEGTVALVDSMGTMFVDWDSGSALGLIDGQDRWELLPARVVLRDWHGASVNHLIALMRKHLTPDLFQQFYDDVTADRSDTAAQVTERYAVTYCPELAPHPGDLTNPTH